MSVLLGRKKSAISLNSTVGQCLASAWPADKLIDYTEHSKSRPLMLRQIALYIPMRISTPRMMIRDSTELLRILGLSFFTFTFFCVFFFPGVETEMYNCDGTSVKTYTDIDLDLILKSLNGGRQVSFLQ